MRSARFNCTFPGELYDQAKAKAKEKERRQRGRYGLSTYLQGLVKKDLEKEKTHKLKNQTKNNE
jgi:hypothetical protein